MSAPQIITKREREETSFMQVEQPQGSPTKKNREEAWLQQLKTARDVVFSHSDYDCSSFAIDAFDFFNTFHKRFFSLDDVYDVPVLDRYLKEMAKSINVPVSQTSAMLERVCTVLKTPEEELGRFGKRFFECYVNYHSDNVVLSLLECRDESIRHTVFTLIDLTVLGIIMTYPGFLGGGSPSTLPRSTLIEFKKMVYTWLNSVDSDDYVFNNQENLGLLFMMHDPDFPAYCKDTFPYESLGDFVSQFLQFKFMDTRSVKYLDCLLDSTSKMHCDIRRVTLPVWRPIFSHQDLITLISFCIMVKSSDTLVLQVVLPFVKHFGPRRFSPNIPGENDIDMISILKTVLSQDDEEGTDDPLSVLISRSEDVDLLFDIFFCLNTGAQVFSVPVEVSKKISVWDRTIDVAFSSSTRSGDGASFSSCSELSKLLVHRITSLLPSGNASCIPLAAIRAMKRNFFDYSRPVERQNVLESLNSDHFSTRQRFVLQQLGEFASQVLRLGKKVDFSQHGIEISHTGSGANITLKLDLLFKE